MKLTIAFDDLWLPLPPMRPPDVRQLVIEEVLELAAAAGVDDVELIVATALHRRMTAAEIKHVVGERVFRSFYPDRLYNFDAEDATTSPTSASPSTAKTSRSPSGRPSPTC